MPIQYNAATNNANLQYQYQPPAIQQTPVAQQTAEAAAAAAPKYNDAALNALLKQDAADVYQQLQTQYT